MKFKIKEHPSNKNVKPKKHVEKSASGSEHSNSEDDFNEEELVKQQNKGDFIL
jgi:hypothetical protein